MELTPELQVALDACEELGSSAPVWAQGLVLMWLEDLDTRCTDYGLFGSIFRSKSRVRSRSGTWSRSRLRSGSMSRSLSRSRSGAWPRSWSRSRSGSSSSSSSRSRFRSRTLSRSRSRSWSWSF